MLHADRLESLLSALLGRSVRIVKVLPQEGVQMAEKGSFVIMDVLVLLEDLGYADLEMQKIGYQFPLERSDCYGADVIMRQYNRLHAELGKGESFDFKKMKPVFCIVLTEKSWIDFREKPDVYAHRRYMQFETGIMKGKKGLREDLFVCLDLFRENSVEINENSSMLEAWLTFLSETNVAKIENLMACFPEFREIYGEIADFVRKPEELMEICIIRGRERNKVECQVATVVRGSVFVHRSFCLRFV